MAIVRLAGERGFGHSSLEDPLVYHCMSACKSLREGAYVNNACTNQSQAGIQGQAFGGAGETWRWQYGGMNTCT